MSIFDRIWIKKLIATKNIEGLIRAFKIYDPVVRDKAKNALVEIGEEAIEPLYRSLDYEVKEFHENEKILGLCHNVNTLIAIGPPCVDILIKNLMDCIPGVRVASIYILKMIGDQRAVEPLRKLLHCKNKIDRIRAAEALETLGWKPEKVADKVPYLLYKNDVDSIIPMGEPAAEILVNHIKFGAKPVLLKMGKLAFKPLIKELDECRRNWAIRWPTPVIPLLGALRDTRAVEPLLEWLSIDPVNPHNTLDVFNALIEIGNIGKTAENILMNNLNRIHSDFRESVKKKLNELVLRNLNDPE